MFPIHLLLRRFRLPTRSSAANVAEPPATFADRRRLRKALGSCKGFQVASRHRRMIFLALASLCLLLWSPQLVWAQDTGQASPDLDIGSLVRAGGWIGYVIIFLSLLMVALFFEHLLSIRRQTLMPDGLAEEVHRLLSQGQLKQAEQECKLRPSFLGYVLAAGLQEAGQGYSAAEKAMEDASTEQSARLFRKIEWLSVIGTLAPMIGLLGTVWGMILAFREFEARANPQVAQLAPGIYRALVTTLMGLMVAVPALASFAYFRNRIDELVAQCSLLAEHVFADFKRTLNARRRAERQKRGQTEGTVSTASRVARAPAEHERASEKTETE
jgi:biopolymer transport protein ExbB